MTNSKILKETERTVPMMFGLNEYLERKLREYTDPDKETYRENVIYAVSCAAAAGEYWLVPVEALPEGADESEFRDGVLLEQAPGFLRKTVSIGDKAFVLCAFTSQSMLHGEDDEIMHIIYPVRSILEELVRSDSKYMILNPWNDSVTLQREDAEAILKRADEIDENELRDLQSYVISPRAMIDTNQILDSWGEGWENENSENWELRCYPIMPDGRVLLLFEMSSYQYDGNGMKTGEYSTYYRVLEFTLEEKELKLTGKYRFKANNAVIQTVLLQNGVLKACLRSRTGRNYSILPMIPTNDDDQFNVYQNVECVIADSSGNVIVGYNGNLTDKAHWPLMTFSAEGEGIGHYYDEDILRCSDVNLDDQERIWFYLFPSEKLICRDNNEKDTEYHSVSLQGFDRFALSRDNTRLLISFEEAGAGSIQYILSRDSDGNYVNPVRFAFAPTDEKGRRLEAKDCTVFGCCSTMKSWVILNADGKLYLYDIDDCCDRIQEAG